MQFYKEDRIFEGVQHRCLIQALNQSSIAGGSGHTGLSDDIRNGNL